MPLPADPRCRNPMINWSLRKGADRSGPSEAQERRWPRTPRSARGAWMQRDMSKDDAAPLVVIGAGGTAGHVVPALAVADALRAEGARVVFVGGERAERELVPEAGYELFPLKVA